MSCRCRTKFVGLALVTLSLGFSSASDVEKVPSGACDNQLQVLVADVIKSFDTVDRSIRARPSWFTHWFRKVHLAYHSQVRLRFELTAGMERHSPGTPVEHDFHCCSLRSLGQTSGGHAVDLSSALC